MIYIIIKHLFSLFAYRIFPWGCASGFLRRIVPDAAPQHGLFNGIPHISNDEAITKPSDIESEPEGDTITLSDNVNNNNNNNVKGGTTLFKRLPSIGERVL